ncbi:hypothetical protein MY8738_008956 [Beauveria namnaoensis]
MLDVNQASGYIRRADLAQQKLKAARFSAADKYGKEMRSRLATLSTSSRPNRFGEGSNHCTDSAFEMCHYKKQVKYTAALWTVIELYLNFCVTLIEFKIDMTQARRCNVNPRIG